MSDAPADWSFAPETQPRAPAGVSSTVFEQAWHHAHHQLQHSPSAALHLARLLAQQAVEAADLWWQGRALRLVGAACLDLAALEEAQHALQEALALAQTVEDTVGELWCRADLGYVRLDQGRLPEAQALLLTALALAQQTQQDGGQGYVHNALGCLYEAVQDLPTALQHYTQALAFRQEVGDISGTARTLANIGNLHFHLGEFAAAQRTYQAALEVFESLGEHTHAASARLNMALQLLSQGQLEEARQTYLAALSGARRLGARETEARCLEHLGDLNLKLGQPEQARQNAQAALDLARQHGAVPSLTSALLLLAEVDLALNHPLKAQAAVQEALTLSRAAELTASEAQATQLSAQVYAQQGNFEQAYQTARRFYDIDQKHRAAQQAEHTATLLVHFEVAQTARREEALQRRNQELAAALDTLRQLNQDQAYLLGRLKTQASLLQQEARRDALTGLHNRRAFTDALASAVAQAADNHTPLSLVFADLDAFKQVNDRYFHAVGDQVLIQVAGILQARLPALGGALAARYGGEEFALLLPGMTLGAAMEWAERVRESVAGYKWATLRPGLRMTVSLGAAQWSAGHAPAELLHAADQALYTAKNAGRNQVRS